VQLYLAAEAVIQVADDPVPRPTAPALNRLRYAVEKFRELLDVSADAREQMILAIVRGNRGNTGGEAPTPNANGGTP
jgi:hypothetical protein